MPAVWEFYRDEVQKLGRPDPGPCPFGENRVVALAKDPENAWREMAPFFLHETNAYGVWQAQDDVAAPFRTVRDVDELRAGGQYRVLTPEQFVEEREGRAVPVRSPPPAVWRDADRARVVEPPPLRARSAAGIQVAERGSRSRSVFGPDRSERSGR